MPLHTIGDSHCFNGWSGIISHHLGPLLCHSFGKETLDRCDIRIFDIKEGDSIVFCLGEIDCRCHVHKYVNTSSYKEVIDALVYNYFKGIEVNISLLQVSLRHVCVYNVVPPVEKKNTIENPVYPYLGTDEERKSYVLYFNQKLKENCAQKGYVYFDVYDKYTDANGFLDKKYSDGHVHIRDGVYIISFIKDNDL